MKLNEYIYIIAILKSKLPFTNFQPAFVQKVRKYSTQSTENRPCPDVSKDAIDTDTSIAMMRDCQLAWEQLRKIRRFVIKLH